MNAYATFLIGATLLLMLLIYVGTAVHKTKRLVGTLLIALTAASSLLTIKSVGIPLGIDHQGGSQFICKPQPGKSAEGNAKPGHPAPSTPAHLTPERRTH